ncbi:hypothetical protein BRCON_2122 [Candidatus Sumerlaea chitinivorans]|uniref:Uncharacterized protein n=1 Tax=Sumerlaea chitinivorans TaxID=2250252 RepID=A0A2Z4Y7M6_SUMC1|nr:hypothetical protein BRCON_2122 [Candidatus Sumerlaea chitinivorans]
MPKERRGAEAREVPLRRGLLLPPPLGGFKIATQHHLSVNECVVKEKC